jgi:hypothetical protein
MFLCFKHCALKAYGWSGGKALRIVTPSLDGGLWPALRIGHFIPRKRASGIRWGGPRARLVTAVARREATPYGGPAPGDTLLAHDYVM